MSGSDGVKPEIR